MNINEKDAQTSKLSRLRSQKLLKSTPWIRKQKPTYDLAAQLVKMS